MPVSSILISPEWAGGQASGATTLGLGQSLRISATGLASHSLAVEITGNNVSNIETPAFYGRRVDFSSLFYREISGAAGVTATGLGQNPVQAGQGVSVGGVSVDLREGEIVQTDRREDFFISGGGYFILKRGEDNVYTRNGTFARGVDGNLVTTAGLPVQGYGVDDDFNIVTDEVKNVRISFTDTVAAQATLSAAWGGSLNAVGEPATQAGIRRTQTTNASSLDDALSGIQVGPRTLINDGSGGFSSDIEITYTPQKVGGKLAPATITLSPSDSISRLTDFIVQSLGINTDIAQPTGNEAGASLTSSGEIQFVGNLGRVSNFNVSADDFSVRRVSDGAEGRVNLDLVNLVQSANGESAASFSSLFDSKGDGVTLDSTIYLEGVDSGGSTWRVLYSSPNNNAGEGTPRAVGDDVLRFDTNGAFAGADVGSITINLEDREAKSPMTFTVDYTRIAALANPTSQFGLVNQDGLPAGELFDFRLSPDGVINGLFSNGLIRPVGQILLARFDNPGALIAEANGIFSEGLSSGEAEFSVPGDRAGTVGNNGLEQSNSDFGDSLTILIQTSVAFSASSRAFATAQELMANFPRTIRSA